MRTQECHRHRRHDFEGEAKPPLPEAEPSHWVEYPTPGGQLHHHPAEDEPDEHGEADGHGSGIAKPVAVDCSPDVVGDRLVFDLLGKVPEHEGGGLGIGPEEQLVTVAVHPAGCCECSCLETSGVGDREPAAHAAGENAVAPFQPPFDVAQRWMLGDEEFVEPPMLPAVLSLLLEVGLDLELEHVVLDCGKRVAYGLHHVRFAVGHAERQCVDGRCELRLERLPACSGVVSPFQADRSMWDDCHAADLPPYPSVRWGRTGAGQHDPVSETRMSAPSAGLEPAHTAPEADALSAELRGHAPTGEGGVTLPPNRTRTTRARR